MVIRIISISSILFLITSVCWSCTIFCSKGKEGQMWVGNNEDFFWYNFSTEIHIKAKTDSTLSFLFFDYPNNNFPQGGVNEAGLFFDVNLVEESAVKDVDCKQIFPGSSSELMLHMLGTCRSVMEVIKLLDFYHLPEIAGAQIHLADKLGNKGIITADSSWISSQEFQVSTNYNLCHDDDDYKKCWRYPVAFSMLKDAEPNYDLMRKVCDSTSQRTTAFTIYSNIHNLTTGEIWLFYGWDYQNPYKTSFKRLASLGDTTLLIRDLFLQQMVVQAYNVSQSGGFKMGVKKLKSITDTETRTEKFKLISLDALFVFDTLLTTGKIQMIEDDILIAEIISASDDKEILTLIINRAESQRVKALASKKLKKVRKSETNVLFIFLSITGGFFVIALIFVINQKMRGKPTNPNPKIIVNSLV